MHFLRVGVVSRWRREGKRSVGLFGRHPLRNKCVQVFQELSVILKDGRLAVLLYLATDGEVTKALESYLILCVMVFYRRGNVISSLLHKAVHSSNGNIHYFTDRFTDEHIVNSSKSLIRKFTDPLSSPDDRL